MAGRARIGHRYCDIPAPAQCRGRRLPAECCPFEIDPCVYTSHWSAEELVDTMHLLVFPNDFPPREYELRLFVYDFETLKPTVEIGVWEAETVLARLRLEEK